MFGKSLFQPEYKILRRAFERKLPKEVILKLLKEKREKEIEKSDTNVESVIEDIASYQQPSARSEKSHEIGLDIECHFFETADDVPDPAELDMNKNNFMIFDDLQLTKQNKCERYYIRGRHSSVDCFYLAQNYFILPRQTIRENTNFICLFSQDSKNVDHIYRDHVSADMDKEEFKAFCDHAWSKPNGFAVIDLTSNIGNGKYRDGLDTFYFPKQVEVKKSCLNKKNDE